MTIFDIFGTIGVAIIILTYVMLQTERIASIRPMYSVLNALGSAMILVSLYYSFNLPSFIVEAFWLVISLFGIARSFSKRSPSN